MCPWVSPLLSLVTYQPSLEGLSVRSGLQLVSLSPFLPLHQVLR